MSGVFTCFFAGVLAAMVAYHTVDCLRNTGIR